MSNLSDKMKPKIDRFSYTPITRGHKPTPSQESNTLSTVSCMTDLSEEDPEHIEDADVHLDERMKEQSDKLNARLSSCVEESVAVPQYSPHMQKESCPYFSEQLYEERTQTQLVNHEKTVRIDIPPKETLSEDRIQRIEGEPIKTLLAGLFLGTGFLATTLSLTVTHDRYPETDPLPDIVFENVKYQAWGLMASEYVLLLLLYTAVMVVLLHSHRLIILRRIWFLLGILYYYRALTMFITVLPKSDETYTCLPKSNNTTPMVYLRRMLTIISGGGLSINGNHVYCGDYIFSGHTVTLTMAALTINQYSPKRFLLLHWGSNIISLLGIIFLLIGRGHYSIDVLIAYYLSTRLWWSYHTMAHTGSLKERGEGNSMSSLCWWHLFSWLEARLPAAPLPNKYSLPLPKRVKKGVRRLFTKCHGCKRNSDESVEREAS